MLLICSNCVYQKDKVTNLFVHVFDDQQHGAVQTRHVPVEGLQAAPVHSCTVHQMPGISLGPCWHVGSKLFGKETLVRRCCTEILEVKLMPMDWSGPLTLSRWWSRSSSLCWIRTGRAFSSSSWYSGSSASEEPELHRLRRRLESFTVIIWRRAQDATSP